MLCGELINMLHIYNIFSLLICAVEIVTFLCSPFQEVFLQLKTKQTMTPMMAYAVPLESIVGLTLSFNASLELNGIKMYKTCTSKGVQASTNPQIMTRQTGLNLTHMSTYRSLSTIIQHNTCTAEKRWLIWVNEHKRKECLEQKQERRHY